MTEESAAPRGYKIESNSLHVKMTALYGMAAELGRGTYHSLLVIGPYGIGKSFGFKEYVLLTGARIEPLTCNAVNLVDELYRVRNKDTVVLFDDHDHVWLSGPMMNTLNIVINARGDRIIVDSRRGGHGRFRVNCRFGFITNKRVDDPKLKEFPGDLHGQIESLRSRFQLRCDLSFDNLDCYHFSCWMATDGKQLLRRVTHQGRFLSVDASNEVLAWFANNYNRLKEISCRTLIDIVAEYRLKSPEIWRSLAENMCNAEPRQVVVGRKKDGTLIMEDEKNPPPWVIRKATRVGQVKVEAKVEEAPVAKKPAPPKKATVKAGKKPVAKKAGAKKPAPARKASAKKPVDNITETVRRMAKRASNVGKKGK